MPPVAPPAMPALAPELYWLTLTALMTAAMWVPYILRLIVQLGPIKTFTDRNADTVLVADWARRAKRAHYNAVENLVIFGLLAVMVQSTGFGNSTTAMICQVYFYARAVHYIVYTLGIPFVRTLAFLVGVACQFALGAHLLGYLPKFI